MDLFQLNTDEVSLFNTTLINVIIFCLSKRSPIFLRPFFFFFFLNHFESSLKLLCNNGTIVKMIQKNNVISILYSNTTSYKEFHNQENCYRIKFNKNETSHPFI